MTPASQFTRWSTPSRGSGDPSRRFAKERPGDHLVRANVDLHAPEQGNNTSHARESSRAIDTCFPSRGGHFTYDAFYRR